MLLHVSGLIWRWRYFMSVYRRVHPLSHGKWHTAKWRQSVAIAHTYKRGISSARGQYDTRVRIVVYFICCCFSPSIHVVEQQYCGLELPMLFNWQLISFVDLRTLHIFISFGFMRCQHMVWRAIFVFAVGIRQRHLNGLRYRIASAAWRKQLNHLTNRVA